VWVGPIQSQTDVGAGPWRECLVRFLEGKGLAVSTDRGPAVAGNTAVWIPILTADDAAVFTFKTPLAT
jgi:hypothetical protein